MEVAIGGVVIEPRRETPIRGECDVVVLGGGPTGIAAAVSQGKRHADVAGGGLISYGPDPVEQFRHAAGYVDRILKGGKPADLAIQAPTKYTLVINFKTAKALGLEVLPNLLARADEVIG
jgi:pyruvate/2-oxoglutarate dehydrogenase complex dihydrolipoamide dehydrogenase (E3) component